MNKVQLIGRLIKDPVLKRTTSGKSVCNFTLAVDRYGRDAGADFPTLIAWEKAAELLCQYSKKGSRIGVIGHIQTNNYTDADGKKVYKTDVILENLEFLDSKSTPEGAEDRLPNVSVTDEELPF
jgi:single-strand DNA-binding protein